MEFSYRGLDFGDGTNIYVDSVTGLRNRSTALLTPDLPRYHGGLIGQSYENPRVISFRMTVVSDDVDAAVDEIAAAFQPRVSSEDELVFNLGAGERVVFARPRNGAAPVERPKWDAGLATLDVELVASDPAIYDNTLTSLTLDPFESSGGLDWDTSSWPLNWGAAGTGGGSTFTNTGSWETWPVFTISGPTSGTLSNPIIENVTTGERLALNANGGVSMTSGQSLIVRTHPAERSIAFSTGASRRGKLSDDSVWFPLDAGTTELRFRASGSTTGVSCLVEARSARI